MSNQPVALAGGATLAGKPVSTPSRTTPGRLQRLGVSVRQATRRNVVGAIAVAILTAILLMLLLGPWLPLPAYDAPALADRLLHPMTRGADGTLHILGTDQLGRDILSRTIYGGRISLGIALSAVIISGTIGTIVGLVAGYRRGWIDTAVMRLVDFQMAMPSLLLAIFLIYLLGSSVTNLIILLSILGWPSYTRIVRSETLGLRNATYVEGAVVSGAQQARILARHILPQILPVLTVIAVFDFSATVLAEAGISFLGFGVQPPETSWGRMISEGQQFITTGAWWLFAAPGVAIFLTVLCVRLGSSWISLVLGTRDSRL